MRRFLASLGSTGPPIFLPFVQRSSDYRARYCLSNCEAEHKRTGAEIVFGWVIWEARAHSFIEAEFHAVVRRKDRELEDITPRVHKEIPVLFVPDRARVAVRVTESSWSTWANHKKVGAVLEPTRKILIQDQEPNVWP